MMDIHDAIKERESQLTLLQAKISTLHEEIQALQIAARILEAGSMKGSEEAHPASMPATVGSAGAEKMRVWP